jgi:hypothetical protein
MANFVDSDDLKKRLEFSTPKKERNIDGVFSPTNDFTRNLFDSNRKQSRGYLYLIMPCICEEDIKDKTSDSILQSIYERIGVK